MTECKQMHVGYENTCQDTCDEIPRSNLHLHIPEALPNAVPHRDPQDPAHRHGLDITPDSILERIYGDGEIRVNSNHHMAIDEVAPGFIVTARCPDGVIEAIEHTEEGWVAMGTQFHPEAPSATAMDFRIIGNSTHSGEN